VSAQHRSLRHRFGPAWLVGYRWQHDLPKDLVAGLALAALLIPESMGYAGVAGVPTQVGLYAAIGSVAAYALTGGLSILVVGPASAVAALSASLVSEFGGGTNPIVLTSALALVSGLLLVVAGVLRIGWIVNFISRPVLEAFVAGLSIAIIVGQLDGLLGMEVEGESVVAKAVDLVGNLGSAHGPTVALGLGSIALLLVLEKWARRIPAAIVVVVLGILLVVVFDLGDRGMDIVGEIPSGLPSVGIPELTGVGWIELIGGGVALLLVGFSEGYAAASATASFTGEDIDANREFMASGTANVASGLVGGLAVSGSLSKSAAARAAGARTQMANLVSGAVVLATLLFLAPVFERLPEPALAAVVIVAVLRSADPRRIATMRAINRPDFVAATVTFLLVLVWETLPALAVGVILSLAFQIKRATFPEIVELVPDAGGAFRRRAADAPEAPAVPGVVVFRFEAALIYANAEGLRRTVRRRVAAGNGQISRVVLDAEMWTDLDSTGAEVLERIDDELAEEAIEMRLARVHHRARRQIARSGLASRFEGRIHPTVRSAVEPDGGQS
jgi:high affinity sulfate transporter 1